jgi:uncharacterized protein (DUF2252 family)
MVGSVPAAGATDADADVTPAARAASGRQARAQAPRRSHADWRPAAGRPDPVRVLQQQERGRVAELLPLRYGRMRESPFAFFRGAAAIMATDLAPTPVSGLHVQLCGDAHVANFGTFSSPERTQVFDISDFDETLPGPWEWDVKRLAASVCVAGRDRAFSPREIRTAVLRTVGSYRMSMCEFARKGNIEVWYERLDVDAISRLPADSFEAGRLRRLERELERLALKTTRTELEKLTRTSGAAVRFRNEPPEVVSLEKLVPPAERAVAESNVQDLLRDYRASLPDDRRTLLDGYRYAGCARKVVGVGSVGLRVWVILLHGRDGADPLLLQAKEARASVLERLLGPAPTAGHAARVVAGQRLMQASSDICLGWLRARGPDGGTRGRRREYYVRQLADGKGSIEIEQLSPRGLEAYGLLCGRTLARAHARAGDRIAIAGYLGAGDGFDQAVAGFAGRYADQNAADHAALEAAIDAGRVDATQPEG